MMIGMTTIPRTMSTQHPDNVNMPFFAEHQMLGGEDEIQEAFYAYAHLGCGEQMWDFEGKEVDNFVVKKLLAKNESFFRKKKLGQDVRLTFRVPNPDIERGEAKILLETLESIPRSFDAAKLFYGEGIAPVFEVILPMTTSAVAMNRIYRYYTDVVVGKSGKTLGDGMTIGEWIGEFLPDRVHVIPLFEDREHMLGSADIVREYLQDKRVPYQRVFLARSDPAVNYGQIATVLMNKIALQRLWRLSEEIGVPIYPILGVGSAPFRGNLRPETAQGILNGYPSVETFTIQSSFKFDHTPDVVQKAIALLNDTPRQAPLLIDEERALRIIDIYRAAYGVQLRRIVEPVNRVARFIPKRRKRKLHTGLFGYSREVDEMKLPRAITFTASMYSLGVPPELLGFHALTQEDKAFIETVYPHMKEDLRDAARFADRESPFFPEELQQCVDELASGGVVSQAHREETKWIAKNIQENTVVDLGDAVLAAAQIRGFLG